MQNNFVLTKSARSHAKLSIRMAISLYELVVNKTIDNRLLNNYIKNTWLCTLF
ncbi:MAG: hypothetical protein ACQEV7_00905 [Bacillota bacterium]